jgi:hypothetical protein
MCLPVQALPFIHFPHAPLFFSTLILLYVSVQVLLLLLQLLLLLLNEMLLLLLCLLLHHLFFHQLVLLLLLLLLLLLFASTPRWEGINPSQTCFLYARSHARSGQLHSAPPPSLPSHKAAHTCKQDPRLLLHLLQAVHRYVSRQPSWLQCQWLLRWWCYPIRRCFHGRLCCISRRHLCFDLSCCVSGGFKGRVTTGGDCV